MQAAGVVDCTLLVHSRCDPQILLQAEDRGSRATRQQSAEALELGLVSRVTDADALLAAARGLAVEICACAPLAVQAAKRMMRAGMNEGFAEHIQRVYLQTLPLLQTRDFQEGFRSFLERREPRFEGR